MADARRTVMVTGGAGFIGSAVMLHLIEELDWNALCVDKLTYAASRRSLAPVTGHPRYRFENIDVCDRKALARALERHKPDAVLHLAAETHVDRSIDGPDAFAQTNLLGTYELLEAVRAYHGGLTARSAERFRLLHVSTDEVFGDLGASDRFFTERTPYAPSSPYSATKAGADHLMRAWARTYDLPITLTHCSNNYGPRQFPEKLIPHMLLKALEGTSLPLYGDGQQKRDWLYVEDHARALVRVLTHGIQGETYAIGGHNVQSNLDTVKQLCAVLERLAPERKSRGCARYEDLMHFVADRPGHDTRYAIDASKISRELGWQPQETFASGLEKTVQWYLQNPAWWQHILNDRYRLERVGISAATR